MKRRIILCLAILFGLCFIVPIVAMVCLSVSVNRVNSVAESHHIQSLRAELAAVGVRIERDLLQATGQAPADRASQIDTLTRFENALAGCGACHHEPLVEDRMTQLASAFDRYREKADLSIVVGDSNGFAQDEEVRQLAATLVNRTTEMADEAAKHLAVRSSDAAASVRAARVVLVATLIASIVIGGLVALHLKRRLTTPLKALLEGIERVRQGDLNHRFEVTGDAECRTLGDAFNQAYDSLRMAQDRILQAEKMAFVGKLAAGVAHEVGNPLASISSVAQMMRRECHDEKEAERLDLIMQHISRVSKVVRELLTFSRPSAENGKPGRGAPSGDVYQRVQIETLLEHTLSLLRWDRRASRIQISSDCEPDLSIAHGNSSQLLLVCINITINALDALSAGKNSDGKLHVSAYAEGSRVKIRFEDNGPGMTQEQIAAAFEPFFTTKEPGTGTGLGLWVCSQIVHMHRASIQIDSRVGEGTTVIVDLPKQLPPEALEPTLIQC
jgi:signal transduction histidine kinase